MSDRNLEMLRRAQQQTLASVGGLSPLFSVIESLQRFRHGLLSSEVVEQIVLEARQHLAALPEHISLVVEAQTLLDRFPEMADEQLQELHEQFLQLDLGSLLEQAERERCQARLQAHCLLEIEEEELKLGHFEAIEQELRCWLDGEQPLEQLLETLRHHQQRVRSAWESYESTYMEAAEWTLEVALADQLLREAHQLWLEGLDLLEISLEGEETTDQALNLLLEGNRQFVLVERLSWPAAPA